MDARGFEPVKPTANDATVAQKTSRRLATLLDEETSVQVKIPGNNAQDEVVEIPASAMRLFVHILEEMGQGHTVTVIPIHAELSTQQAADLLNVSRPYLVQLLDNGVIPHRRVGTHRRVLFEDVMRFKNDIKEKRRKALAELSAEAQELKLGY